MTVTQMIQLLTDPSKRVLGVEAVLSRLFANDRQSFE
jgi:hypothetical protein